MVMCFMGRAGAHQQPVGHVAAWSQVRRRVLAVCFHEDTAPPRQVRPRLVAGLVNHRRCTSLCRWMLHGWRRTFVAVTVATAAALPHLHHHGRGCVAALAHRHRRAAWRRTAALQHRRASRRAAVSAGTTARRAPIRRSAQLILVIGKCHAPRAH